MDAIMLGAKLGAMMCIYNKEPIINTPPFFVAPGGWFAWTLWQGYGGMGEIPGISNFLLLPSISLDFLAQNRLETSFVHPLNGHPFMPAFYSF